MKESIPARPKAVFYPASGFPSGVYGPLLDALGNMLDIDAVELRPVREPGQPLPVSRSWQLYADDLISYLEKNHNSPVIGIGHSIGASSLVMAAAKRPDLFSSLVLIESTQFPKLQSLLVHHLPRAALRQRNPSRATLDKPRSWSTRQEVIDTYRQHPAYKRISNENLRYFGDFMVAEKADGRLHLRYSPEWESLSYMAPPYLQPLLKKLKIPVVAIRGKPSLFVSDETWNTWRKNTQDTVFLEDRRFGHLLPLEAPLETAALVEQGLKQKQLV